ncbi:nucleotidyltransferase [Paenibacillus sp. WLX1005]|uniref:nucleotidyltransferase n=1 Tax=Paenibacillus sp. WLX1005 TaxID=3243766 RepID=UPI003984351F
MKVTGVIVEYNPLHYGHQLHLERTRQVSGCDAIIAVMSGGFTQRGEPAVFSKWARSEMALSAGCDLVLELPSAYAVQPAEWFAYGAVAMLHATGITDSLVFGSESGSLEALRPLADLLTDESPQLQQSIRHYLDQGMSYPAALGRAATASDLLSAESAALLGQPNNTLGLQYMIALRRLQSNIAPLTIQREQSGYHDMQPSHDRIASATAIRQMLLNEPEKVAQYVPPAVMDIIQRESNAGRGPVHMNQLWMPLLQILTTSTVSELEQYYDMNEGIEYRLKKLLPSLPESSVHQLVSSLKTKRYTYARLQRLLAHLLLGHRRDLLHESMLSQGPAYLRVLGFTATGQELLKRMKQTSSLPIVMRAVDMKHIQMELDIRATVMQAAGFQPQQIKDLYSDYYHPPVRV